MLSKPPPQDIAVTNTRNSETNSETMVADIFVAPAYAGGKGGNGGGRVDVCAIQNGDNLDITIQTGQNNARRKGRCPIDGRPDILYTIEASDSCDGDPDDLFASVAGYSSSGFTLLIDRSRDGFPADYRFSVYVPLGTCPSVWKPLNGPCED